MSFARSLHPRSAPGWRAARRATLPASCLALCLAAGCAGSGPAAKEPVRLDIALAASARVNPDEQGRAAPIQVRIYELKAAAAFEAADYFTLAGNDKAVLQGDLLVRTEYLLRPGESQRIQRRSQPDTTAIGVLAGYRDLPASTWRAVHPLPEAPDASWMRALIPARKVQLKLTADEAGLRIEPVD